MPEFSYRAADTAGAIAEGRLEAPNQQVALRQLRDRGLTPIRIGEAAAERTGSGAVGGLVGPEASPRRTGGRLNQVDVLALTTELAIMLRAGLALDSSLRVLVGMSHKRAVADLIQDILENVKGGAPLSRALARQRELFGDFYINMVRSGEASGKLAEVLARLVEHMERTRALRDSVVSATIYPAILLAVAVLSLIAMLGFVVPQFETLFRDMGDALPLPTRIVLDLGKFFTDYGIFLAPGAILVAWALRRWLRGPRGRDWWQERVLATPLLGRLVLKYDITRFSRSLGTLLGNGVPILAALGIATETVGNRRLREALADVVPKMKGGGKVADAIAGTGLFEPLAVNLVRVGEETGRLDAMMLELARIFDRDVENGIKRGLTLLEPLLILTLGVLIGAIIVSILLGILSINDLAV